MSYPHYKKDVRALDFIDVYRVLGLFEVTSPPIQHAIKKLLCAGKRGTKDRTKDYEEAVASISRALEMEREDTGQQGWPRKADLEVNAYPATTDPDGWHTWYGSPNPPVHPQTRVEVMFSDGYSGTGPAGEFKWESKRGVFAVTKWRVAR